MRVFLKLFLPLVLTGILTSCAATPQNPLYERLGGQPAIVAVVDDFITNVAADPAINKRFAGADIPKLKRLLVEQICEATGGPCKYSGRTMKDSHRGMEITATEFTAMGVDMAKTLDKFGVPECEKGEVMALLVSMQRDVVGQ